jgi:hypothetical protein
MRKLAALFATTLTLGGGGVMYGDARINPYEDKGTHYELPIVSDIPQGERVEIAKDKAAMTLKGWNDEYAITITPQIPSPAFGGDEAIDRAFSVEADRPLLSQKMEYRSGDVTAFIEPKEGTANEFDIDFTLHAKPETNVFEYKIEGAEQFDFFYQPELTPEEIAEGAERPENVVGSFAVYHRTKKDAQAGHTNYATGKAFHIYRPKAIDANGNEVWAELSYSQGVLAVIVPEKWIETAAYPVVVDPTFGSTQRGGSSTTVGDDDAIVTSSTLSNSATVSKLTAYSSTASAGKKGLLYANSGSEPAALTATSNIPAATDDWYDLIFPSPPAISAGTYWIGIVKDTASNINLHFDASAGNHRIDLVATYASPANPWDTAGDSAGTNRYSVYATFTTSDTGTFTETFNVDGYNSWTAPTGASQVIAACWGAGGGGGVNGAGSAGGGGGGGAFASSTLTVTPGTTYGLWIGEKGAADVAGWSRESSFATSSCPNCVIASGGQGTTNTTAGAGGPTASSTGTTKFAGGDGGAAGGTFTGGGGGGSAGPHGNGNAGQDGQASTGGNGGSGDAGAGSAGGAGGNGADATGADAVYSANGGGGGGGGDNTNGTGGDGGNLGGGGGGGAGTAGALGTAAAGQCTITYTIAGGGGGGGSILDQSVIWFD